MAKTETLHIRLEPEVKTSVESILRMLGLSASEAVNIFFPANKGLFPSHIEYIF